MNTNRISLVIAQFTRLTAVTLLILLVLLVFLAIILAPDFLGLSLPTWL